MTAVLVLNADDFGLTEGHNQAVVDAYNAGALTSASLLANGAAFDEAVHLARQCPMLGIGVHLTLIEGHPVAAQVDELLTDQGLLPFSNQPYTKALLKGRLPTDAIRREFDAQIQAVLDSGIQPTHLDGHRYIHLLPGITEIVIDLAQKYDISVVRCLHRPADVRLSRPRRLISLMIVMALSQIACRKLRAARLRLVDHSIGFMDTGHMNAEALHRWLRVPRAGVTELFSHPAYHSPRLEAMMQQGYQRIDTFDFCGEANALCNPDLRASLLAAGWTLRHFGNAFDQ